MSDNIQLQYGKCDIYVDGNKEFPILGDVAEFVAEPEFEDIDLYEVPHYDKVLTGWNVSFKIVLEDNSFQALKLGLPTLEETENGGLTDGGLFQRARDKAKEIRVHPHGVDATNLEADLTIFKAFPITSYEKKFGKELSKWEIQFQGLARTADATKVGNYFKIGE